MTAITARKNRVANRPRDRQRRVVPRNPDLAVRVVEVRALVLDLGGRRDHAEAVREARGDIALAEVVGAQADDNPASERRRAATHVNRDVEDLALDDAHQLALGPPQLEVETSKRPAA